MKRILLWLFAIFSLNGFSQQFTPDYQSNPSLNFGTFLSGVKYAYVGIGEEMAKKVEQDPNGRDALALMGVIDYLNKSGFENVSWGGSETNPVSVESLCYNTTIKPSWTIQNNVFTEVSLTYESCNHDFFRFISTKKIPISKKTDIRQSVCKNLQYLHGLKKASFDTYSTLSLPKQKTSWTGEKMRAHFSRNGAESIEGIYENTTAGSNGVHSTFGIIKSEKSYQVIYFTGAVNHKDWLEGEKRGDLTATANANLFKANWWWDDKTISIGMYITFDNGMTEIAADPSSKETFVKLFPTIDDLVQTTGNLPISASGFAISADGLVVTNHHVIKDATSIHIRGINGDFSTSYKAKVVAEDKNNDLAILQIVDEKYTGITAPAYMIGSRSAEVGSSLFVLGYPLRASMGDEIKLTAGIISSRSGYQGDITNYQISAAVQPGNSGGPVFDENGDVIGIISARHNGAENASYAVKSSYLTNLLEALPSYPSLPAANAVNTTTLSSKVKSVKEFVYIVEAF